MGVCYAKPSSFPTESPSDSPRQDQDQDATRKDSTDPRATPTAASKPWASPFFPFYTPSPARSVLSKKSPAGSAASTPRRLFRMPPSPARHIRAALARRQGSVKPKEGAVAAIPEDGEEAEEEEKRTGAFLDKRFGFGKGFEKQFEMGEEVGRGHFGYTCLAKFRKGELKGEKVAVKVIPKAKVI